MNFSLDKKLASWTNLSVSVGDRFLLGNHTLICWDACDESVVRGLLSEMKKVELILTDPPYGVDYVESKKNFIGNTDQHISIENDQFQSDASYSDFTKSWLVEALKHLEEKNTVYIFNSDKMIFPLRDGMKEAGMKFSQLLVWVKNSSVIGRLDYLPQHELIAYGWYGRHAFYGNKARSVLFFPRTRKNTIHPTMKPIPLLRELILNSSRIGWIVYDPFGWSGSTLIACEQTARECVMIEKEPLYCERIIRRWERLSGKIAIKL